jgi:hypothetical protein
MKKYKGWTNYETWVVNLWISNEQSTYCYWREQARMHRENAGECKQVQGGIWTECKAATFNLADQLEEEVTEGASRIEASMYSDLVLAALGEVNWGEIADSWLED